MKRIAKGMSAFWVDSLVSIIFDQFGWCKLMTFLWALFPIYEFEGRHGHFGVYLVIVFRYVGPSIELEFVFIQDVFEDGYQRIVFNLDLV